MPAYELVIFDWDGTLMDSTAHIVDSLQKAAVDLAQPVPSDEDARHIIGLALPLALKKLFPEADADMLEWLRHRYAHHFVSGSETNSRLFAGAQELLDDLKRDGCLVAIATGKSRIGLDRVLAQTGLNDYFVVTRCADETASKPDPLMLQEILAFTGKSVAQAVMVGDTSYDLEMARRLDMPRLGVSFGAHDPALLQPHAPVAIVDDVKALRHYLW